MRSGCVCAAVALTAVALLAGAGEPEVVRARVPSKDVAKWFRAGTELRVMPANEFDSLVKSASAGLLRQRAALPPRLIRARHHARYSGGVILGRSELVIEAARTGPADFLLEPWTPAILAIPGALGKVGARDSGKTSLWIDRSPNQTIVLDWELKPQSHPNGRRFGLELTGNETTELLLDAPKTWVPFCRQGHRRGPGSSTAGPDQNRWVIESESGGINVHIDEPGPGMLLVEPKMWVTGATQVDLRRAADSAGGLANWKAEWRLELDPRNPKPLRFGLDPGLELIDIQGSAVRGYRTERTTSSVQVVITLDSGLAASTELRILAHAAVKSEGQWRVPGLVALDAVWTGGTTTVLLDEFHVLKECRERAGRLVFPSSPESASVDRLEFKSGSPGSVAELVFQGPRAETSCAVKGRLFVSESRVRLESELDCSVRAGTLTDLEMDLGPAWLPERVVIRGIDDPIAWHSSVSPSGGTRLQVSLPSHAMNFKKFTVMVRASSSISGGRGPLQLPRVRLVGAQMIDEAWVASADPGTMIQPTEARGLAWLDPREVPGLAGTPSPGSEFREALAWRWIAPKADARVERQRIGQQAGGSVRLRAKVDSAGSRLLIDGRINVYAGAGPLDSVSIWIGQADLLREPWRFTDQAGAQVAAEPITDSDRARLGFPKDGQARRLVVKIPDQTEKTIRFHAEYSWNKHGLIPLVALPREYQGPGMVVVEAPDVLQGRLKSAGLRRLAPAALDSAAAPAGDAGSATAGIESPPGKKSTIDAFTYLEPGARLELFTEPLSPIGMAGLVREALLTTSVDPRGPLLNRLRMLVNHGELRSLDLALPPGITLVRVRRDGIDITPIRAPGGLSIPLTESGAGSKTSAIVVDYIAASRTIKNGTRLWPELPRIALPCLSFVWEVVTSSAWQAGEGGPGLIAADEVEPSAWPYSALGLPTRSWSLAGGRGSQPSAEVLRLLDNRLADSVSADLTFAEWLCRFDAGPWPVLVDRIALSSAGIGPKSQCVPTSATSAPRNVLMTTLEQYGLSLVPFPDVFVITTKAELARLEPRDRAGEMFTEALIWGSDRLDRFQTLARWRGEQSPRLVAASGQEAALRIKLPPGWQAWRFECQSWPSDDAFVCVIDTRTRILTGWIIAGVCLLTWLLLVRRLGRWRIVVLAMLMAVCAPAGFLLPLRYASAIGGAYFALVCILVIELGRSFWRPRAPGRVPWRLVGVPGRRVAGATVSLVFVVIAIETTAVGEAAGEGPAILALFPYEGHFDPSRPVADVILRLADFTRLKLLAANETPRTASLVRAVDAVHRLARKSDFDVVVESRIELEASGRGPFAWQLPVSLARDIHVTLDGKRLPIAISRGGVTGKVEFPDAGNHVLEVRRSVALKIDEGRQWLNLPVNPLPTARIVLEPDNDGQRDVELVTRGETERDADHRLVGRLGPADRIQVCWGKPAAGSVGGSSGNVDGLILWDITPAGDQIRARFTFRQSVKRSTIRLAHQPGLILRSARTDERSTIFCAENAANGEWTLQVVPPLVNGSTVELDCWLPLEAARTDGNGKAQAAAGLIRSQSRGLPRLDPVGVERFSGSLGVRRPGDWVGRFDPLPDTDPISDESFVESWGALPQEPLTLCGTSRFLRESRASLQTGPAPTRVQVNPTVNVQIESGRVAMTVDAELTELSGHLRQIEVEVPENIQIFEVTCDGLTDWTIAADHRLHLIFDRPINRPKRRLHVLAWIPVVGDPLQMTTRQHGVRTPWFWWHGVEPSTGFLTISSTVKPEMRGSTGLTLISSESSSAVVTSSPSHRSTFRVDDSRKLGEMVWDSPPARVNVVIESQMTLHPDSAEWVAVLRYDVTGGALDAIHLKLPAAWAASVSLQFSDGEPQLTKETRGPDAFWTITPARPIWGSERFVLRASRELDKEASIVHPEITPRGEGVVDAYLSIINATGLPMAIESTAGLDKIPFASWFQDREFARIAGTPLGAFRVVQKSWLLKAQSPQNAFHDRDSREGSARVAFADVTVEVLPDRSMTGRAVYDTVPGTGSQLSCELPPGSSLLWATVDFNNAIPLRSATGAWSIACDPRRPSRIGLLWRTDAALAAPPGPIWPVALPRAGSGPVTTLITVYTPRGWTVKQTPGAGFEAAGPSRLEMARADWLARCAGDLVAKFDRSSGRDHQKLVSLLINQEMSLRGAERNARWARQAATKEAQSRVEHNLDRIRLVRTTRDDTMKRAGLEEDLASARSYLGEARANVIRPMGGVPEPSEPDRIRLFGQPSSLMGIMPGIEETRSEVSLTLEGPQWDASADSLRSRSVVAILVVAIVSLVVLSIGQGTWPSSLALAAALGLAGYTGGPLILASGIALAVAGWTMGRR